MQANGFTVGPARTVGGDLPLRRLEGGWRVGRRWARTRGNGGDLRQFTGGSGIGFQPEYLSVTKGQRRRPRRGNDQCEGRGDRRLKRPVVAVLLVEQLGSHRRQPHPEAAVGRIRVGQQHRRERRAPTPTTTWPSPAPIPRARRPRTTVRSGHGRELLAGTIAVTNDSTTVPAPAPSGSPASEAPGTSSPSTG